MMKTRVMTKTRSQRKKAKKHYLQVKNGNGAESLEASHRKTGIANGHKNKKVEKTHLKRGQQKEGMGKRQGNQLKGG